MVLERPVRKQTGTALAVILEALQRFDRVEGGERIAYGVRARLGTIDDGNNQRVLVARDGRAASPSGQHSREDALIAHTRKNSVSNVSISP